MEDQRPTVEGTDRGHPLIGELLRLCFGGLQFPEFSGLVANFATGLIFLGTRNVRIGCFHATGLIFLGTRTTLFRAAHGKGLVLRT